MSVSVCMATHNGSRYLREQVDSILPQLGTADELVVVDDGSSDDSVAVLQALADPRIRVHCNDGNLGPARSFERALGLAQGEIVFLADQDDVWLPGRVEAMVAALDAAELVVSDCRVVDQSLVELHPSFFARRHSGPGLLRNLARNSFLGCCMAMRRRLLPFALPFPTGVPMHDWWLGLVGQSFGRVVFLPEPLLLYRRHGANASTTAEASAAPWSRRIRWRLQLLAALIARKARVGRSLATTASRSGKSA